MPTVPSFDPKANIIIPDSCLDKMGVVLKIAALKGHMVATVAGSAVSAAIHEGRVRLLFIICRL